MNTNPSSRSSIEATAADWIARRDAGLSPAGQAEFERWQAADPRHAQALIRHARAWNLLDRPMQRGHADAMARELRQRARTRRHRRVMSAALAGVAGLIVAAVYSPTQRLDPIETATRARIASTAQVIQPETRVLPDGSIVELKRGAVVDVSFSDAVRAIALREGEAHFQVQKEAGRPFVVTAGSVEFRAVGTAFAVQLGQREVELIVTHGTVAVERPVGPATASQPAVATPAPSPAPQTLATVDAGKRLILDLAPTSTESLPVLAALDAGEMAQRLAWRATRLEFTGTRLADAGELMSRHNGLRFVIADPALRDLEVTGFFRADNTDAFLLLLEGSFGAKVERSGNTITIRKGP